MRERVRARERFLNDERLKLGGARREGEAIGVVKGEAIGEAKKARESAAIMKQEGFDTVVISRVTGLPLSEIERLG